MTAARDKDATCTKHFFLVFPTVLRQSNKKANKGEKQKEKKKENQKRGSQGVNHAYPFFLLSVMRIHGLSFNNHLFRTNGSYCRALRGGGRE